MDIQSSRLLLSSCRGALVVVLGALSAAMLVGCWDSDPCDPGQVVFFNGCFQPPPPPPPTGSGSTTGTGGATGTGGGATSTGGGDGGGGAAGTGGDGA